MKKPDDATRSAPRKIEPIEVYRGSGGHVVIRQSTSSDDTFILVHPAQVPVLVQWLQEVAAEFQRAPNAVADAEVKKSN